MTICPRIPLESNHDDGMCSVTMATILGELVIHCEICRKERETNLQN